MRTELLSTCNTGFSVHFPARFREEMPTLVFRNLYVYARVPGRSAALMWCPNSCTSLLGKQFNCTVQWFVLLKQAKHTFPWLHVNSLGSTNFKLFSTDILFWFCAFYLIFYLLPGPFVTWEKNGFQLFWSLRSPRYQRFAGSNPAKVDVFIEVIVPDLSIWKKLKPMSKFSNIFITSLKTNIY